MITDFKDLHNPASDPRPLRANLNPGFRHHSTPAPNYYDSPDWWQLHAVRSQDFPEARDSVVRALRELHALQEPNAPTS